MTAAHMLLGNVTAGEFMSCCNVNFEICLLRFEKMCLELAP